MNANFLYSFFSIIALTIITMFIPIETIKIVNIRIVNNPSEGAESKFIDVNKAIINKYIQETWTIGAIIVNFFKGISPF